MWNGFIEIGRMLLAVFKKLKEAWMNLFHVEPNLSSENSPPIAPIESGKPLSPTDRVFRFGRGELDFPVVTLSTDDRKSRIPRLSVWLQSETTPEQGLALMGPQNTYEWYVIFEVQAINKVKEELDGQIYRLTTVYDLLPEPKWLEPGGLGHAGIEGLEGPPKVVRKALRSRLLDLASTCPRYTL